MGESTFVNEPKGVRSSSKKHLAVSRINTSLVIVISALLIFGLIAVFSASWDRSFHTKDGSVTAVFTQQVIFVILGIAAAAITSFLDYHYYKDYSLAILIMGGVILMLISVLFVGSTSEGDPKRAFFGGSIQPSEAAKLAIILYLSVWLTSKKEQLDDFSLGILPLMVIVGFTAMLIAVQPDLSAAVTIIILGVILFFLAGSDFRHIVLLIIIAVLLLGLAYAILPTARVRISSFIAGVKDPVMANHHAKQAMAAISRGSFFGVGIGNGTSKYYQELTQGVPVPWTDSIFVVIAEETGLVGSISLVALYILLLIEGMKIANGAPDLTGKLLAAGISLWITFEAIFNIGGLMNIVPVAGNALPLISSGGSSMLTTMAGLGILINVSRQSSNKKQTEGRPYSAVVDLRGGDWRGSVSRSRRPQRTRK